ncbi:MAG: hypothetical protein LBJ67_00925, partial [Planctomycetaceae bacterium]|nr:hypothetical protein [Planctomycetaceae bacterium]
MKWLISLMLSVLFFITIAKTSIGSDTNFVLESFAKRKNDTNYISADFTLINYDSYKKVVATHEGSLKYDGKNYWQKLSSKDSEAVNEISYVENDFFTRVSKKDSQDTPHLLSELTSKESTPLKNRLISQELFGYIPLSDPKVVAMNQLFSTMEFNKKNDSTGGSIIIAGKNDELEFTIWLEPLYNNFPSKIQYHRLQETKDKSLYNSLDCTFSDYQLCDGIFFPHKIIQTIEFYNGVYILDPNKGGTTFVPVNKVAGKRSAELIFKNVHINRDLKTSDFAITMNIPEGEPVYTANAPQIGYRWSESDGKPAPAIDESMKQLRGQRFILSPAEPRFWLMSVS